ncbi:hypothetical protein KA517_02690 [Candidatus Gracilibacteria bacterium]|nr:hypothetical protein [Candidatus Gracilibacteria bacterium]
MSRKLLIKFLSLTTALTLLLSPLALPRVAHADALNSVVSGIGGAFAGAGAGAGIGGAVGGLIGGRSGTSLGAAIGAIAGGIAGGIAGATGNLNGLNGLGFGQFSNYGIHVPQGTVLQANTPQLEPLIVQIINFFLGFVGVLAFLMLVYGGFRYLSSAGEAEAAKKGKQTISYAVIGVVIIALSYAAVNTLITGIGPQVSPNATGLNVVNNFPAPGVSRVGLGFSFRL